MNLNQLSQQEWEQMLILSKLIDENTPILADFKPFFKLKYSEVSQLKNLAKSGDYIKIIEFLLEVGIDEEKTEHKAVINFNTNRIKVKELKCYLATFNFIDRQFEHIYRLEKELETEPEPDLIAAGIDELNKLGEFNVIDALANGDPTKWEKIIDICYEDIYSKLLKTKIENDIRKRLETIYKSRNQ